jgi:hypothetical protein
MRNLKIKIAGFDRLSGLLNVRFAFSDAARPIDDYEPYQLQVLDDTDAGIDQVLRAIGQAGWSIAEQQEAADAAVQNDHRMAQFAAMVGKEFDFQPDQLFPPPAPACAATNQPQTTGLIEL